tara:strand:- start:1341 stop:1919 length:579 start_codon:yes stop_codon:yes gene_type:complete
MPNILEIIEGRLGKIVEQSLLEASSEKGLQLQTSKEIQDDKRSLSAGAGDEKVDEADDESEDSESGGDMSKRPVNIPDVLPAAITVDMVIDGIDAIRSARSLKKPEVRQEFEDYFNSLSAPEKVALLAFVFGVAETLIGDSPGRGLDPSEEPYNITMKADPEQSQDASKVVTQDKSPNAKDSGDTPIVVGGQ